MLYCVMEFKTNYKGTLLTGLLSLAGVSSYSQKITIIENGFSDFNIERLVNSDERRVSRIALEKRSGLVAEDEGFYGINHFKGMKKEFKNLLSNALYYYSLPVNCKSYPGDLLFYDNLYDLLEIANTYTNHTIVNMLENNAIANKEIIELSKYVLVILPFDYFSYSNFVSTYKSIIDKCIFISFQEFLPEVREMEKIVNQLNIPKNRLLVFPYSEEIETLKYKGNIFDYMHNYYFSRPKGVEYRFVDLLKKLNEFLFSKDEKSIHTNAASLHRMFMSAKSKKK